MNEAEYWELLRFRINSLPTSCSSRQHSLAGWCDWFEPKRYVLDGPSPCITGRVGFVDGHEAWEQRFTLLIGSSFGSPSEIEWEKFLPPQHSDAWLWSEELGQVIVIDPCGSSRAASTSPPDHA